MKGLCYMKFLKSLLLCAGISCSAGYLQPTTLTPAEIFEKWVKIQYTVRDHNLDELAADMHSPSYLTRFKKNYEASLPLLRTLQPLLTSITDGAINESGYNLQPPLSTPMEQNIAAILHALETDPTLFVQYLQTINFVDPSETSDKSNNFNFTVEKYKALIRLLVSAKTPRLDEELGIAIANRLVEFCYSNETFPIYQATMQFTEHHSIARMLHTVIWYNIIGTGWKLWHENCLHDLKQAAQEGKRIKYLAGGNDVYTLLCNGIYNITIIDPFLPSQARYYANGWEWLIAGNPQDEIIGNFGADELKLVRTKQVEGETFIAKTGGQFAPLKKYSTTWTVYKAESEEKLGSIIIERRFVQQSDLALDTEHVFLMSYDEFIYLGLPSILDGWGITPNALDENFLCYIKQLRKPLTKHSLNNLRIASMINYADLKFINLASDPN